MKNRIRLKILAYIFLISAAGILLIASIALVMAHTTLRKNLLHSRCEVTHHGAADISEKFKTLIDELAFIAEISFQSGFQPEVTHEIIKKNIYFRSLFESIGYSNGMSTLWFNRNSAIPCISEELLDSLNLNSRASIIFRNGFTGNNHNRPAAVPVFIESDGSAGVYVFGFADQYMFGRTFDRFAMGAGIQSYIIAGEGLIFPLQEMEHPVPERIFLLATDILKGNTADTEKAVSVDPHEKFLNSWARIQSMNVVLVVTQPLGEAFLPMNTILSSMIFIVAILVVLSFIPGVLIFNAIMADLNTYTHDLSESEQMHRMITENTQDIIMMFDSEGTVTYVNNRLESLTGYSPDVLLGKHIRTIHLLSFNHSNDFSVLETLRFETIGDQEVEAVIRDRNGTHIVFDVRIIKLPVSNYTSRYLCIAHDRTEKKRMYQQLVQAEKLSSLGELVAGIAHELNNPLMSILGFAELVRGGMGRADTVKQDLEKIILEATRAKRIVQNLLVFARQYPPEKSSEDINAIIESVLEVREYEMAINNIDVERILDPNLPKAVVDPHQMRQVLLNIVNNAINAMKSQSKEKMLTVMSSADDSVIKLTFHDTGPGIPVEYLEKVFDPFFTTLEVGMGTGLGLSISYGIIKEHGGRISAFARKGEGSQFLIEIPAEPVNSPFCCNEEVKKEPVPVKSLRVLVLENEDSLLKLMKRVLSKEGCTVDTAATCEEAELLLSRQTYNVFVRDITPDNAASDELHSWIERNKPEILDRLIFVVGENSLPGFNNENTVRSHQILKKPFTLDEFKNALYSVVPVHYN